MIYITNKSLPIDQRLGQVGVNTKSEEMIISKYNNTNDIVITFLHNWIDVKTTYKQFRSGKIKNPLHYKEKYEEQIRVNNQGLLMQCVNYIDSSHIKIKYLYNEYIPNKYYAISDFLKGNIKCLYYP